jgi:hypothetical protein
MPKKENRRLCNPRIALFPRQNQNSVFLSTNKEQKKRGPLIREESESVTDEGRGERGRGREGEEGGSEVPKEPLGGREEEGRTRVGTNLILPLRWSFFILPKIVTKGDDAEIGELVFPGITSEKISLLNSVDKKLNCCLPIPEIIFKISESITFSEIW